MNLLRNRTFAAELALMAGVLAILAALAWLLSGPQTSLWVLGAGVVACALFWAYSVQRFQEIAQLAAEVDEILHGGRRIDFSDYREGDLAVLKNELTKMTSALAGANEHLNQEKQALANALADVSHQIRTPLTAISLLVPTIEDAQSEAERARALRELEGLVDRVGWLVTTLLKLAKADAGAIRVQAVPVDVARLVHDALAPLAGALDLRGITVQVDVQPGATFTGDAAWSAEALGNVLKNCMEHTATGGTIRISATEDAVALRLRVVDTGPGIAPEDLPHLFERFYRGAGSEGFGIGLSLAQALATAQGGTLRASNNRTTSGARFDFTFPKMVV
ncbi:MULTISPECIES: sensor histidine kinase [Gordonibacter]|uniref:histidine kinase n=1 Tax=Gordonibacter faecis TaxID=3047475 RepID=A0ABT7DJG4_9ACTN|nr:MULTISPECIES: HAMP domain-containing sensor histidine kinase [unclassified Gordonibacter]MDJ1649397.1 HAMP domain-containing sensor histidine kinase [Gordonibacter sp. KGMB12511]HIW75136.1 HAMP domain-containing histidine kinase [Candidatus Gordonibacter avicola]